jgi:hypothetical protein
MKLPPKRKATPSDDCSFAFASLAIGLVHDLPLGGSHGFDNLALTFSLNSTGRTSCTAPDAVTSGEIRDNRQSGRALRRCADNLHQWEQRTNPA